MYIVKLISEDETMGRVINNKKYVSYLSSVSFDYETTIGYKYKSNTCNMQNNGNTLILTSVNDDINCIVYFEKDMKKITFNNNGGSGCTSTTIQKGQMYGNLCTPNKSNYVFDGWYTSNDYVVKINSTDIVNKDINLYAKWKVDKIVYSNLRIRCANYSKGESLYSFNYTGNCAVYDDGNDNWRIKFLTSGTLTMNAEVNIDMFLVGGGGNGAWNYPGAGGYTKTIKGISLSNKEIYSITIGQAGNTTSFGNVGSASAGGSGSNASGGNNAGANGISNCGDWPTCSWYSCYDPGSGGSYGRGETCEFGDGTASGCTRGDNFAYSAGGGGCGNVCTFYTGANGKGLSGDNSGRGAACGGSGSSGVVVIRNAR